MLVRDEGTPRATVSLLYAALSFGVFVAVSGLVARAVHHLAAVPFDVDMLFASTLFQTALSIAWALLAMAVMIAATRLRLRTPWFVGAALLALVGVKLLVVDLSNAGTLARIISFVGVGLLVLLIGYFSPAPPRRDEPDEVEPESRARADGAIVMCAGIGRERRLESLSCREASDEHVAEDGSRGEIATMPLRSLAMTPWGSGRCPDFAS